MKGIAMEKTLIVYHPPKADRVGRINEALILFQKAELGNGYYTSRDVKRDLEKDSRGGDQLKYSRFVGMWKKEDGCSVVNFMHPDRTRGDTVLIVCYDWQEGFIKEFYSDIADRKQIWVQTVETGAVVDFFSGESESLTCRDSPHRL